MLQYAHDEVKTLKDKEVIRTDWVWDVIQEDHLGRIVMMAYAKHSCVL